MFDLHNSETILALRSRVRRHYAAGIVVLSVIALSVFPQFANAIIGATVFVVAVLMVYAAANTRRINKMFGGSPLQFVHDPTPIGSLLQSLKRSSVRFTDIAEMHLMSSELTQSFEYLSKDMYGDERNRSKLNYLLEVCPELKLYVVGPADDLASLAKMNADTPDRIVLSAVKPNLAERDLVEHKNLIVLKDGTTYVWYEPFHKVVDGRHFFGAGAYLYQIGPDVQSQLRSEFGSLAA